MGVLNSFYLLFKSNAGEVIKDIKAAKKEVKDLGEETKKTSDETSKMGETFTNAIDSATRALATYVSYQAIKTGIINAEEYNRKLSIQSRLWGTNVSQVAAYGEAVKAAGGSAEELFGWYDQVVKSNAANGRKTLPFPDLLQKIHNQTKGLSASDAEFTFQQYGISGVGMRNLLRFSDADFNKTIEESLKLTSAINKGSAASEEFGTKVDQLKTAMLNYWTSVDNVILPVAGKFVDKLKDITTESGKSKETTVTSFTAMSAAAVILATNIGTIVTGLAAMGGWLAKIAVIGTAALDIGRAANSIVDPTQRKDSWLATGAGKLSKWITGFDLNPVDTSAPMPSTQVSQKNAMDFWIGQGYSKEQAAALAATELSESGGNPAAVGDGGQARGIFQWHPDRVAEIYKGTGIDVRAASLDDQRRAAAWELKNSKRAGWSDTKFRNMRDINQATAYLTDKFITPADIPGESLLRAQIAMQLADSVPTAATTGNIGSNVNIDKIEINTQATDAQGIAAAAGTEFRKQMRLAIEQNNDAVAY